MESLLNLTTNVRRFLRILVNFPLLAHGMPNARTHAPCVAKHFVIAYLSRFPRL
jgi:hypothetical protein